MDLRSVLVEQGSAEKDIPKAVSFDGINDSLSYNGALVGAEDSSGITISFWLYIGKDIGVGDTILELYNSVYPLSILNIRFISDKIVVTCKATDSTLVFSISATIDYANWKYSFIHVLVSADVQSTSFRHMYINDVDTTITSTQQGTHLIGFESVDKSTICTDHDLNVNYMLNTRVSDLFIDNIYRNLDVVENRRLFITESKKPTDNLNAIDGFVPQVSKALSAYNPYYFYIKEDGSAVYINESLNKTVYKYNVLSPYSAYTIDTSSVDVLYDKGTDVVIYDITFSPDGHKMYAIKQDDLIHEYYLPNAWTITNNSAPTTTSLSAALDNTPGEFCFNSSGTKMYMFGDEEHFIYQWSLSTPWSTASLTYDSIHIPIGTTIDSIIMVDNDTILFVGIYTYIYKYELSIPGDISSAVLVDTIYTYDYSVLPVRVRHAQGLTFINNGSSCVLADGISEVLVIWFDLDTPYDLRSISATSYDGLNQPLIYLPLKDADSANFNDGTSDDFVINGALATAVVGPNQDFCSALHYFDENYAASSVNNNTGGNILTVSFNIYTGDNEVSTENLITHYPVYQDVSEYLAIKCTSISGFILEYDDGTNFASLAAANTIEKYHNTSVQFSCDLSNMLSGYKCLVIDGVDKTSSIVASGVQPVISTLQWLIIGAKYTSAYAYYITTRIGDLYFDYSDEIHINIALNNEFLDNDLKPIGLRKVVEDSGHIPLMASIMQYPTWDNIGYGNVPSRNLVAKRGAGEYSARSIRMDSGGASGTNKLTCTGFSEEITKTIIHFNVFFEGAGPEVCVLDLQNSTGTQNLTVNLIDTAQVRVELISGSYAISDTYVLNKWGSIFIEVDWVSTTDNLKLWGSFPANAEYVSGSYTLSGTGGHFDSASITNTVANGSYDSYFSQLYVSTDISKYIDFSQEENRDLFVDQLGFPKDLDALINNGTIPKPLIYLPAKGSIDDIGNNSGTADDFTVVNAVVHGPDFS